MARESGIVVRGGHCLLILLWIGPVVCRAQEYKTQLYSLADDPIVDWDNDQAKNEFQPVLSNNSPSFVEPLMVGAIAENRVAPRDWEVLPDGLLYRSYIAGPHESRFATVLNYDVSAESWRWDAALGGRVGLWRKNQPDFLGLDTWQIDLEGAALPRMNPHLHMDVESIDYRFGTQWTGKRGNLSFKFGYFHLSSHVGDEYLIKNPTFSRINFVRESLVLGTSLQATCEVRVYGEVAWAFVRKGEARAWQFQTGVEYAPIAKNSARGALFSAVNLQLRQEVNYAAGLNVMTGWQWKGPRSGRTFRVGLQYYNGPTNQYEFLRRYDNQLGFGMWFDY